MCVQKWSHSFILSFIHSQMQDRLEQRQGRHRQGDQENAEAQGPRHEARRHENRPE